MSMNLHGYIVVGMVVRSGHLRNKFDAKFESVLVANLDTGARYTIKLSDTEKLSAVKFVNASVGADGSLKVLGCELHKLAQFSSITSIFLNKPCLVIAKSWDKDDYNFVLASPTGHTKSVSVKELIEYKQKYGVANIKVSKCKSGVKNSSGYVISALKGQIPLLEDLCSSKSNKPKKPTQPKQSVISTSTSDKPMYFKPKAMMGCYFENNVISCFLSGGTSYTKLLNILVNNPMRFKNFRSVNDIRYTRSAGDRYNIGAYDNSSIYNRFLFLPFIVGDIVSNKDMFSIIMSTETLGNFGCFRHIQNLVSSADAKLSKIKKNHDKAKKRYDAYGSYVPEQLAIQKERSNKFLTAEEYTVYLDYKKGVFDSEVKKRIKQYKSAMYELELAYKRYDCYHNLNKMVKLPYFAQYVQRGKLDFVIRNARASEFYAKLVHSKSDLIKYVDILALYLFAKFYANGNYDILLNKKNYANTSTFGDYILLSLDKCSEAPSDVVSSIRDLVNKKKGV